MDTEFLSFIINIGPTSLKAMKNLLSKQLFLFNGFENHYLIYTFLIIKPINKSRAESNSEQETHP